MGMQLFAKVEFGDDLNRYANFQTFGSSMLTLLRSSTGEGWNSIMYQAAHQSPGCARDPAYNVSVCGFNTFEGCTPIDGCGSVAAYPYFISFQVHERRGEERRDTERRGGREMEGKGMQGTCSYNF